VWQSLDRFAQDHMFLVNRSQSLPNWAFFVARGHEARLGQTVFFMPPMSPLVIAHFGRDPAPFGKIVYATGGDEVIHRGSRVLVRRPGGQWREIALMKPVSLRGEALAEGPTGVIPNGCFYLGTPHKDGFDSRYAAIGFICWQRLVGSAKVTLL
jgi:conjugal transfer pilin signal peptidase TrbI